MLITRRALLASLGALGLGLATVSWSSGVRSWVLTQIEKEFGAEIAGTDDAAAFTNELVAYMDEATSWSKWLTKAYIRLKPQFVGIIMPNEDQLRIWVIEKFLLSTNYIIALETTKEFEYLGLFDPYSSSCANQLSALHLAKRS